MRNKIKEKKLKKFTTKMQAKLLLVFCILIIAMVGLIGRLVYINRTDGERYEKRVLSQQTYTSQVIPYKRGNIVDTKGTILATSEKVYNLILDVKSLLDDEKYFNPTTKAITESYSSITAEALQEIITSKPKSQYVILQKGFSYDEMMVFKEKAEKDSKIHGVWFEEDYVRKYPYKTLASDVLGFTTSGNVGNWGIEQFYNDLLNGTNGIEYGYIDSELKLDRTIKPAINGNTIVTTIDANVQGIVQNHIKQFNQEFGSKNIGVIVMNPNNGEIIAMASNEEYDLNNPTDLTPFYTKQEIDQMNEEKKLEALNQIWRNFTISDTYEPGSTFKPFTIASALEEAIINSNDTYYCDGYEVVGGWTIQCSKRQGHGQLTLEQALMVSCNDALMQIVAKEGKNLFFNYQNFFGFGGKTNIDLPGEAVGILIPEENIGSADLATSSFGQTFTNTMIQLAAGYSSLVNGGYYYQPHIVKQIVNDKGAIVENMDKLLIKETVSEQTSAFIREAMFQTVENGTAKYAQVPGYKVGGKTGTAEKYPRSAKTYLVSFIGAVPADNPEIVVYVVIDEPQNVVKQADSSIATKLTSRILSDILPFLELYPTEEIDETKLENTQTSTPVLPSTNENSANVNTENNTENSAQNGSGNEDATSNNNTENSNDNSNETNEDTMNNGETNENTNNNVDISNELDDFNPDSILDSQEETEENEVTN
jgi:stage V sporulation protein D (sporulation-specific penicillin-binding protein)